jgi:hypothetical protein
LNKTRVESDFQSSIRNSPHPAFGHLLPESSLGEKAWARAFSGKSSLSLYIQY